MFETIPAPERPRAIRDVTAWLGTLGKGLKFKVQRHSDAERGRALYHEIGCVACHAPASDFKPVREASAHAVPMPDMRRKTSLPALQDFLLNTGKYRADQRMPPFPLTEQEAMDIAAHLLDFQSSDPREAATLKPWPESGAAAIERGRLVAEELNCAACHQLPGIERKPAVSIGNPAGHCLTGGGSVRYGLSGEQQSALVAYLTEEGSDPPDGGRRMVDLLGRFNCYACHERGGSGGPTRETDAFFIGDPALGDAGRIPPPLDHVGYKLLPEALVGVIANRKGARVRPYLKTRMPAYLEPLASGLAKELIDQDQPRGRLGPGLPEIADIDDPEAGKKLLGTNGGVNCITCHRWGDRPSLGIQGMDISSLDERLSPEWFRDYLLDPAKYRPGTLMPAMWPGGKSSISDVLGGDAEKQIGAIWSFIRDAEALPDGFPEIRVGEFELLPEDRPIIQRSFVEGVGTQAILVGFPGGINLAYDAERAEPRLVWRGRFFDAYNTWFSRFAPMEKPLEPVTHRFGKNAGSRRFLGYEIDTAGSPTFLSASGGMRIEDRFAVDGMELVRTTRTVGDGRMVLEDPDGLQASTETGDSPGITITRYSWR